MAIESVVLAACNPLYVDPSAHPDPQTVLASAEQEGASLMQEIEAVSELLFLAETNSESQMNDDTAAYVAMVLRRLSRLKIDLDVLRGCASMAVRANHRAAA